ANALHGDGETAVRPVLFRRHRIHHERISANETGRRPSRKRGVASHIRKPEGGSRGSDTPFGKRVSATRAVKGRLRKNGGLLKVAEAKRSRSATLGCFRIPE